MAELIRAFIAIELPQAIQQQLGGLLAALQRQLPGPLVRWVPASNIHLTLKFLGDVSTANIGALADLLSAVAAPHSAFEISVGGLGAFPNSARPRLLWVGVNAPPDLAALQRAIDQQAARLGFPAEARPFSPHLTLGRVRRDPSPADLGRLAALLAATRVGSLGLAPVTAVHLFRSDLKPGSPVYTRLFSAPLATVTTQA
jgi:2'-5' RNA ligase